MRVIQVFGLLTLSLTLVSFTACGKKNSPEVCTDGQDNDGDDKIDCDDTECATAEACAPVDTDTTPTSESDCNDGVDEDNDNTTDCDDSDCEGSSDCLWVPFFVSAGGAFAYDATNDEVKSGISGGTTIPPYIDIEIQSQAYNSGANTTEHCQIILTYNGTESLPLETFHFTFDGTTFDESGFLMPDGEFDVTQSTDSTCDQMDTANLGTVDDLANSGWGVTVGNTHPDVQSALDDSTMIDATLFAGGGFYWLPISQQSSLGLPDGVSPFCYSQGIAVDPATMDLLNPDGNHATSGDVTSDNLQHLLGADVTAGPIPPTGYYSMGALIGWSFSG
jgi:hypothetical protein